MVERSTRSLLLAIILIGNIGLQAELLLLDHADSATQWIPHVVLLLGLISIAAVSLKPGVTTLKVFKLMMFVFILTGVLGLYFHFAGNVEFAKERSPELSGLPLIWESLRGATPSLAPGALVQLGLLGLLYGYRYGLNSATESST